MDVDDVIEEFKRTKCDNFEDDTELEYLHHLIWFGFCLLHSNTPENRSIYELAFVNFHSRAMEYFRSCTSDCSFQKECR